MKPERWCERCEEWTTNYDTKAMCDHCGCPTTTVRPTVNYAKNDSGPAYPSSLTTDPNACGYSGMTLRDYFAAAAMQGLLTRGDALSSIAVSAWSMADAMLAERDKR